MPRMSSKSLLALLPLLLPCGAGADVYKYVDSEGHVSYTDNPDHAGYKRVIMSPLPVVKPVRVTFGGGRRGGADPDALLFDRAARVARKSAATERNRSQYAGLIEAAATRHGLDPALLHAVIRAESSYNPGAVSNKGAMGLMQLMPGTAARYGVRDPYDPQDNVLGGARYLSDLLDMFDSDVALAVAAYNAGENNVIKYGNKVPPFAETRDYVSKVLSYYNRYSYN
jgi:soluble lytic murein transglycosylase-like protein